MISTSTTYGLTIPKTKNWELLNHYLIEMQEDRISARFGSIINRLDANPTRIRQLIAIERDSTCINSSNFNNIILLLKLFLTEIYPVHSHEKINIVI